MPRITTFLTYGLEAEEAARFYVSVFPNSRIVEVLRYREGAPMPAGTVMTVAFELDGQPFMALNAGSRFAFGEGVSLAVACETQEELDRYWARLTDGGREGPCGWLTDRFGVTWQVYPAHLPRLLAQEDAAAAERTMSAMGAMKRLDIAQLEAASAGVGAA
jgi:predicted 3-demethylubiquinone-9 3-methyltransferase (glyoxalase superfamily)